MEQELDYDDVLKLYKRTLMDKFGLKEKQIMSIQKEERKNIESFVQTSISIYKPEVSFMQLENDDFKLFKTIMPNIIKSSNYSNCASSLLEDNKYIDLYNLLNEYYLLLRNKSINELKQKNQNDKKLVSFLDNARKHSSNFKALNKEYAYSRLIDSLNLSEIIECNQFNLASKNQYDLNTLQFNTVSNNVFYDKNNDVTYLKLFNDSIIEVYGKYKTQEDIENNNLEVRDYIKNLSMVSSLNTNFTQEDKMFQSSFDEETNTYYYKFASYIKEIGHYENLYFKSKYEFTKNDFSENFKQIKPYLSKIDLKNNKSFFIVKDNAINNDNLKNVTNTCKESILNVLKDYNDNFELDVTNDVKVNTLNTIRPMLQTYINAQNKRIESMSSFVYIFHRMYLRGKIKSLTNKVKQELRISENAYNTAMSEKVDDVSDRLCQNLSTIHESLNNISLKEFNSDKYIDSKLVNNVLNKENKVNIVVNDLVEDNEVKNEDINTNLNKDKELNM
jgi:ferritin-like protein